MYIKNTNKIGLVLLGLLTILALLFSFSYGISGNDFWWHIKAGQWIVENKRIPNTDIFSWIGKQYSIEWIPHEWLSEVIFYGVFAIFGEIGIYAFSLCLAFFMQILIAKEIKNFISQNIIITGLYFVLFTVTIGIFFYGRPQIFSYFLLYFLLKVLYRYYTIPGSKCIYFVPVIACLWSNLHAGSSPLVYILCIIFLLISFVDMKKGRIQTNKNTNINIIRLLLVTVLGIGFITINPIGIKALLYPFYNISESIQMSLISEWNSPDAKSIGCLILCYFPILFMNIGFITYKKNIELIDIIIAFLFIFLFLRSSRFIILWYIAVAFYGFKYVPKCNVKKIQSKKECIVVIICIITILGCIGYSCTSIKNLICSGNIISKSLSEKAIKVVKKNNPKKLFNDYNISEMLIYNDIDVFFDSRADLFSAKSIFNDGVSLLFLQQVDNNDYFDIDNMINKYKFDGYLILKNRPLYSYLENSSEYKKLYSDNSVGYFIKN